MRTRGSVTQGARAELAATWSMVQEASAYTDCPGETGHAAAWAAGYARRTVGRLASQELPPATVGGNWLEVPQTAETDDGFPADTAALRAAYVLGRVVDAGLVQSLVQMLVAGAQQTFKPPPPRGKQPKARPAPPRPKPGYASKPKAQAPPKPKQSAHQRLLD